MPEILHHHETQVWGEGCHGHEDQLWPGEVGPMGTVSEVGLDQREDRHGQQNRQRCEHPLHDEGLLPVPDAADQQVQPDHCVEDDHDRRKDDIPGQEFRIGAAGEHHRYDQCDFYGRHRQRQQRGSERFAHPMRYGLGMMHSLQHRPKQYGDQQYMNEPSVRVMMEDEDGPGLQRDKEGQY